MAETIPKSQLDEILARAQLAISLGERTGSRGQRPENIYNVAADLLSSLASVTAERDAMREALEAIADGEGYAIDIAAQTLAEVSK